MVFEVAMLPGHMFLVTSPILRSFLSKRRQTHWGPSSSESWIELGFGRNRSIFIGILGHAYNEKINDLNFTIAWLSSMHICVKDSTQICDCVKKRSFVTESPSSIVWFSVTSQGQIVQSILSTREYQSLLLDLLRASSQNPKKEY